jgi:hypothetical protein
MTRTKTGDLTGQVPFAATGDRGVSDEEVRRSDSQLGGYTVKKPDGGLATCSESEFDSLSGDDGPESYAREQSTLRVASVARAVTVLQPTRGPGRGPPGTPGHWRRNALAASASYLRSQCH